MEIDEVDVLFHQAFKALEFVDVPDVHKSATSRRLLIGFDDIGSSGAFDDIQVYLNPYINAGASRLFMAYIFDGEEEWYMLSADSTSFIPLSETRFDIVDESDFFGRLKLLAEAIQ